MKPIYQRLENLGRVLLPGFRTRLLRLYRQLGQREGRRRWRERQRNLRAGKRDLRRLRMRFGEDLKRGREFERRDRIFLVVSGTNLPMYAKFQCLLAKILQRRGYTPVVVNDSSHDLAEQYFRLFGISRYIRWTAYLRQKVRPYHDVPALATRLMEGEVEAERIKEIRFQEVSIGKYALSSTFRALRRAVTRFDEEEARRTLRTHLIRAAENALGCRLLLRELSPQVVLVRDPGYTNSGPFLERSCQLGIDSLVMARGQREGSWILKRYRQDNLGEHEFSLSQECWRSLRSRPWTAAMDAWVEQELRRRYDPTATADFRRLQKHKQLLPPEEVRRALHLDPERKTAVIFAHISWDGAFFFGKDLFPDFDICLLETTRAACRNANLNWIVKLHPLNILKRAQEGGGKIWESEMEVLRTLLPLPPHVRIMPSDTSINTASLFPAIDYGLTVRGTIGLELPCLGIPCLTAGTGRYENRGFTVDSRTAAEYLERLAHLQELPRLSREAQQLARKHYYYLMRCRQFPFDDIAPMTIRGTSEVDSDLFDDLQIRARGVEDIWSAESLNRFADWVEEGTTPDLLWDA